MKKVCLIISLLSAIATYGQDLSYSRKENQFYRELPNPVKSKAAEWSKVAGEVNISFADDNIRYPKESVPQVAQKIIWNAVAWKGEKIHSQILIWTKLDIPSVTMQVNDLVGENHRIPKADIRLGFVRYVMTDVYGGGCDTRKPSDFDSSLVADPIDIIESIPVSANTVQPIWVSVQVPADIPAGRYSGFITINARKKIQLKINLKVQEHELPPPARWKYDLDLWQSPAPIANVHHVRLWSDEHFTLMKPYFTMLAGAGQKSITALIIDQPWGKGHVYHEDPSLITWTKKKDGTWSYDYSLFDRYVEMVMSCGINQRINCYSMVTWDLSFIYRDEASGDTASVSAKPGSQAYKELWTPMLQDFTAHLKQKGWFGITAIAMDERPLESMKAVIALLKQVDPEWKIALAGDYHPEIVNDIYDYCIILGSKFDPEILKQRKEQGKPSTYYTACGEERPNGFTFSPPAENTWISWYAAAAGFTGYLRWAYNNWVKDPLLDSRFRTWPGGDLYQIYPGPRSSIRFEKLIEGIQDFEKIRLLKEQLLKNRKEEDLLELNTLLSGFTPENLEKMPAAEMVNKGKVYLNNH